MNAGAICDGVCTVVSRESASGDRGTPGLLEDPPQQRFADVLPLAEAALEPSVRDAGNGKTSAREKANDAEDRQDAACTDLPKEAGEARTPDTAPAETQDLASPQGRHLADLLQPAIQERTRGTMQAKAKGPITEAAGRMERRNAVDRHMAGSHDDSPAGDGNAGTPGKVRAAHGSFHPSATSSPDSLLATAGGTPRRTSDAAESAAVAGKKALRAGPESPGHGAATGSQEGVVGQAVVKNGKGQDSQGAPSGNLVPGAGEPNPQASAKSPAGARQEPSTDKTTQASPHGMTAAGSPRTQETVSGNAPQPAHAHAEGSAEHATGASDPYSLAEQKGAGKGGTGPQSRNAAPGATTSLPSQESVPGVRQNSQRTDAATPAGESPRSNARTQSAAHVEPASEPAETGGKEIHSAGLKEGGSGLSNPSVLPGGESAAAVSRAAGQGQNQMGFDTPVARTPAQSVGEQILDSMQASIGRGDRQVLVRLNPPELGTVLVRFQEQGDRVSAMMEVASREVRREIEQALPQVVRTLQEAGVQIRRVEVVTSDQPERDLGREQLPQDTWSQPQQDSGQNREHLYASPQGRWARGATNHGAGREEGPGDESRAAASQGRIDMLL